MSTAGSGEMSAVRFYSLRRYVKNPRENCGNKENQREKHDNGSQHTQRRIERRQKN